MARHEHTLSANYIPGVDDYYLPPVSPEVVAPEPKRYNPDMSAQIAEGIQSMDLNGHPRASTASTSTQSYPYDQLSSSNDPAASLSPFPKLVDPPPNVPPSDDELETRLDQARELVLNSNDPEMQLTWASDVLIHCGVCADEAARIAAAAASSSTSSPPPRASTPRVEHQLKVDAKSIVTFLAEQHHPRAEYMRGMWLEWGRFGEREDKKEAFRCYSRAADKGYARAEYRIGMLYESYNDPVKALRHYHRGVDAGDAASCYRLGMMTLRGQHGQPQDFTRGIDLIKRSAAAADDNAAQGAYVYGMLLTRQLPQIDIPDAYLPYDENLARENIERAAYMKFAKAQTKMGSAYELGALGCDFNPLLSVHYNALASKQGEAEADMALSKWFLVGAEGSFPKNENLAFHYAERAAQCGLATAEFALGYFNEIGMCVPVNLDKAVEWYDKAAKHGNEDAKGRVEALANKQVLSRRDHEKLAVSRIKSQHGSRLSMIGGGRPDQGPLPPLPSAGRAGGSPNANGYNNSAFPPRGSSSTPYPEDNGPPSIAPSQRSASVAPYPEDAPAARRSQGSPYLGGGPPANGHYHNQSGPRPSTAVNAEMRPSSAFQINPEIRANSVAAIPQQVYDAPRPYANSPQDGHPPRSFSARPYEAQQYDNQPYDAHGRPPADYRMHNGPPVPAKYAAPPPSMMQHQQQQQPLPPMPPGAGRPNIGFTAPFEDRRLPPDPTYHEPQPRQRFNSMGRPPNGGARPPMPLEYRKPVGGAVGGGGGPRMQQRSPSMPQQMSPPAPQQRSPPLPQQPQQRRPMQPQSQMSMQPPQPQQRIPQQRPSQQSGGGAAVAAAAAPGKTLPPKPSGPKTFEEMGVPAQKREEDCVIM